MFSKEANIVPTIRWLAVGYVALIVLEGALRKWALPSLSNPLLLAREPIVLVTYFLALTHRKFPVNAYIMTLIPIVTLMVLTTVFIGHGDPFVTFYGIRTNILHIPYAFIVGSVFYKDDVIKIGRWWLIGTIPMTVLIAYQFYSPQSAWINQGPGGVEGAGFSGALGRYRPPGTFSFINGVAMFYTYSTAFLVAGITQHQRYPKWLLFAATSAIVIAAPISISRGLVIMCGFTLIVGIAASGLQSKSLIRYFKLGFFFVVSCFIAVQIPIFNEAKEAFLVRWERSTGEDQGGISEAIGGRIVGMFTGATKYADETAFFGHGIGAGTQVGGKKLFNKKKFTMGESEWSRIISESGLWLGGAFIFWRIALCFKLTRLSLEANVRGDGMSLIFLSAVGFNILNGQIGQTTTLGFTTMGLFLLIACLRGSKPAPKKVEERNEASA